MQNLSNSENTLLGMVTAAGVAFALQPTLYYKNAAQQGLEWKLFAHPRLLYRGMTASTMAQVGELGLQFLLTGYVKKVILGDDVHREMSDMEVMSAALLGGSLASLYVSPAELIMIQQQNFGGTLAQTLGRVVKQRGPFGLYRGFSAAALRDGSWTLSLFGFTPIIQEMIEERFQGINMSVAGLAASVITGTACGIVTCPFDVIKTSQQGDLEKRVYTNFWNTMSQQRYRLFSGVIWRIANVAGTIIIANEFRMRIAPLMFPDKYQEHLSGEPARQAAKMQKRQARAEEKTRKATERELKRNAQRKD